MVEDEDEDRRLSLLLLFLFFFLSPPPAATAGSGTAAVDEDLAQRGVHPGVLGALGHQLLQEGRQQPEPVAPLDLLAERVDGNQGADREDEVGHKLVGRVSVEEAADDGRRRRGVDLLDVGLDVARGARGPEVSCQR